MSSKAVRCLFNALGLNFKSNCYSCPDLRRLVAIDVGEALLELSEAVSASDPSVEWRDSNTGTIAASLDALVRSGRIAATLRQSLMNHYTSLRDWATHEKSIPAAGKVSAFLADALELFASLELIPESYQAQRADTLLMDEFCSSQSSLNVGRQF
jgi:hypothetical protein